MIPANALTKIRSVIINYHYLGHITGFKFFDKDGALLWEIGNTYTLFKKTVQLEENEVIVGLVAKLHPSYQSRYTDF